MVDKTPIDQEVVDRENKRDSYNVEYNPMTDIKSITIKIASPEEIKSWSSGEITKPETINYRSQRPEKDGLYCEKIFGPAKDWTCYCGKYKGIRYKGITCDKCGVLITRSNVRRERMGHITLAVPVTHTWFLRGTPTSVGLILDMTVKDLEKIVYFANYVVLEVYEEKRAESIEDLTKSYQKRRSDIIAEAKDNKEITLKDKDQSLEELDTQYKDAKDELMGLEKKVLLTEGKFFELNTKYPEVFKASIGAEAVHALLKEIKYEEILPELEAIVEKSVSQKQKRALRRLSLLDGMRKVGIRPEHMILSVIPVIPPDLRPMVQLDGGRFATSDLNDLYRRVINRNNRLKRLLDLGAPEVIVRNEKRMLQESVDSLIDNNSRRDRPAMSAGGRKRLSSLTDILKGKQGRFRQNLLGKRVDYSGRSVIVVGPQLRIDECGIPKNMALELFKPFVIGRLIEQGVAHNVKIASRLIDKSTSEVWDVLDDIIADKYVLLNRAPTLHRLSIQAFRPILIEGKAIQLHPLVCSAYNADFDGDQMAVHLPLSDEAQREAKEIMCSKLNLLKPASGKPIVNPTIDMVLGIYYMTELEDSDEDSKDKAIKTYVSKDDVILAYKAGIIKVRQAIKLRVNGELVETTCGRVKFNMMLPEGYRYVNETLAKTELQSIMADIFKDYGTAVTAELADNIKDMGFDYAGLSGLSVSIDDFITPDNKQSIIDDAEVTVKKYSEVYNDGLITDTERYNKTVSEWKDAHNKIEAEINKQFTKTKTPLLTIVGSKSRGNVSNIVQTSGMIGLVANPAGRIIELPIRSGYKQGVSNLEYFIALHGSRKGLTDTALKTAESGYLTRKLVDVAQEVVVREKDCGDKEGNVIIFAEFPVHSRDDLALLTYGRTANADVMTPGGEVLVNSGEIIDDIMSLKIVDSEIKEVKIRSIISCKARRGVCQKCYGLDLAHGRLVNKGEAIGVIAAQSIGEPGTQLTMRTFHAGGVAGEDITHGLPRVEEIFEARSPKGEAILASIAGKVNIIDGNKKTIIRIEADEIPEIRLKLSDFSSNVEDGAIVAKGDIIASSKADNSEVRVIAEGKMRKTKTLLIFEPTQVTSVDYTVSDSRILLVKNNSQVGVGDKLTEGSINLQDLLLLRGEYSVQQYIINEVQKIYAAQGESISSKHIETIIKQMFSKVRIVKPGKTPFVEGQMVSKYKLGVENDKLSKTRKATFEQLLLSITKVSTSSDSWLSAASFQETTRVLIKSALSGEEDFLHGLKENVIIGRLIPAGTGYEKE